ncbi:hypothetical protein I3760_07G213700 [Carya illinoinensis]|nr:hypothetical protein I3760_07G213700 [Carya illinoinensis]
MTMGFLSPSPSLFATNHPFLPHHLCFRNQTRATLDHKKCRIREKLQICGCDNSESATENGFSRRDLVLFSLSYSLSLVFPSLGSHAEEELKMVSLVDDINAYSYLYPVELPSKKFLFKWVESRKPERYSSAAPLSPDARLRIVSERVDIIDNLIISVSIGPPNSQFIKTKDKRTWTAKDVADSVLSDKSALATFCPKYQIGLKTLEMRDYRPANSKRNYMLIDYGPDGMCMHNKVFQDIKGKML